MNIPSKYAMGKDFRCRRTSVLSNLMDEVLGKKERNCFSMRHPEYDQIRILVVSRARWPKCRNEDTSKKIFVATKILVFDFELFIGIRCDFLRNIGKPAH